MKRIPLQAWPGLLTREVHLRTRPLRYRLYDFMPSFVRLPSSQTDRLDYTSICRRAAEDPATFATFKRHPSYTRVLEHVTEEQGQAYLDVIAAERPELLQNIERFHYNDTLGAPRCYQYDVGMFSPTTLRYLKVVGDIKNLFGGETPYRIVEVGSAYGGQCAVLHRGLDVTQYTAIDLPDSLRLMRTYTQKLELPDVEFVRQEKVADVGPWDLFISNYSFSECTKATQDHYLEHVIRRSARGYITYNSGTNTASAPAWAPYGREQILERLAALHDIRIFDEWPATGSKSPNFVLVWGDDRNWKPSTAA